MKKFPTSVKINDVIPFVGTASGNVKRLKFVGVKYPQGRGRVAQDGFVRYPMENSGNVFFCDYDEYTERNGPCTVFYVAVWHRFLRNENPKATEFLITNDGIMVITLATSVQLPDPEEVLEKMTPAAKKKWFKG